MIATEEGKNLSLPTLRSKFDGHYQILLLIFLKWVDLVKPLMLGIKEYFEVYVMFFLEVLHEILLIHEHQFEELKPL